MENKSIYLHGNEKILNFFKSAYENGKIAHAYIFEGGRGSGKHTLARRLACLLACSNLFERPCFECSSCRKISEGISPDVIEISLLNDKKTIGVEQIRELRSSVYVKPSEENIKVYIISNAELMTVQAQNVFLKVLEEPPRGVFFFMLCENTSNILATVKSRAPILKMQNFSDAELTEYLINNNKKAVDLYTNNREAFELIIRIADGKIGEAERLISDMKSGSEQSKHDKARNLIELLADSSKFSDFLIYMQKITKARDELVDIVTYCLYAIRDLMVVKKMTDEHPPMLFYGDVDYAQRMASRFTSAAVMKLYDELCCAKEELTMNANVNNLLVELAFRLRSAANI
ncbi:MAG: hypothetical protein E7593_05160 [Ruminococcaceae bacterium]|nr:hypothetical protein [Oscillospiraceae bacterium]